LGCFDLVKTGLLAPVGQVRPTLLEGHDRAQELPWERAVDAADLDSVIVLDIEILALVFVVVAGGLEIGKSANLHSRGSGGKVDSGGTRKNKTMRMKAVGLVRSHSRLDTWSDSPMLGDNGGAVTGIESSPNQIRKSNQIIDLVAGEVQHARFVLPGGD
jgi:hypothetical protein